MNSSKVNVLLVDDKKENIYSLQSLLEDVGNIHFLHALTGNDALKICLKEDLALILLDVQMPEMDGYEVAHILKNNKATEYIPIIFVTALDQAINNVLEGYSKGGIDYLFKPLNPTITKAKVQAFLKMHEQRKYSESLATLVNNCQDLLCIVDGKSFKIITCNAAWSQEFGFDLVDLPGTLFFDLFVRENNSEDAQIRFTNHDGKLSKFNTELQLVKPANTTHWIFWNFTHKDGNWYASGKDISLRKISESELKQAHLALQEAHEKVVDLNETLEHRVNERTKELTISRERFEAIARATNDTLWDWNLLTNEFWWSGGYNTYYGYNDQDAVTVDSKFSNIHPDEAESIRNDIQKLLSSRKNHWSREYRFVKSDGSYASILDRAFVLYDSNGTPVRVVGSMFDLTEIKKVQRQLNSINLELSNKNEELSRINRDMDNFIYTTSHDLKAPVSNIEGLISTMDDIIIPEAKNETYQGIVDMIRLSIEKFKITLKDLSEIAKADGEDHNDVEETSIQEMLEEVKVNIQQLITENKARIIIDNLEVPVIKFSRKNLRSIFYNLLSNAIKYKSDNRVPEIKVSTHNIENQFVLLRVQDNGLGIREEDQDKVFKMFKRLHNHVEGTGVGMSIVKRIVDNSGGRIELESKVGEGSVFKVYLRG